jgi:prepilin-type N-terminal cleavage/methylation domain-containing protein
MTWSTGIDRRVAPAPREPAAAAGRHGAPDGEAISGRAAGFTVIELLLVMLIIGTMAGLSAPRLRSGYERLRLTESASSIGRTIRLAREAAITERTVYRMTFDGILRSYRVERVAAEGSTYEAPGRRWAGPAKLPGGIEFSAGPREIWFAPDGSAALAGYARDDHAVEGAPRGGDVEETAELVLTGGSGKSVALVVDLITGGVRMEARGR